MSAVKTTVKIDQAIKVNKWKCDMYLDALEKYSIL